MPIKYKLIFYTGLISGILITVGDYLAQMRSVEPEYFTERLISLPVETIYYISYGCIFLFPLWLSGYYLIYKSVEKVNKPLAGTAVLTAVYSTLTLMIFHFSYIVIYTLGKCSSEFLQQYRDRIVAVNDPFNFFMFILLPLSWIVIAFLNWNKKSFLPRLNILLNPVCLSLLFAILTFLSPAIFESFQPGIFSVGVTLNYITAFRSIMKKYKSTLNPE